MSFVNNFLETRHIRVFVSSTFADMQDERNALMKKTFPLLREKAAKRNVSLTELDLRWGITPEESESGKVVEICLREIENSVPFFIGIIGSRYGWIPSENELDPGVMERFPQVESYLQRQLSVTEMEMQFGVLEREEDMHAYFFIHERKRMPWEQEEEVEEDGADEPEKLAELKKAVMENGRYPVSSYSSPEDLSLQVEEAFTKLLDSLFPEEGMSEMQRERVSQNAHLNSLCQNYIRRQEFFDGLNGWLSETDRSGRMAVSGPVGSGKSALLANWIKEISGPGHPGNVVVYHFVGRGGCPGTVDHVLSSICYQLRVAFGYDPDEREYGTCSPEGELAALLERISAENGKTVVIVLDAVERLVDVDYPERMDWLPLPCDNVKVVFSINDGDGYYHESKLLERLGKLGMDTLLMQPLIKDERISMVNSYLALYSKKLQKGQVERIASDDLFRKPLVLRTLLDELINFGHFRELDKKIGTYLGKDDSGFFQLVVDGMSRDFVDAKSVLSLIAISGWGLYEEEILSITGISQLEWSRLFCALRPHLMVEGGLISFSNVLMSRAVADRYFNEEIYVNPDTRGKYPLTESFCREKIIECLKKEKQTARSIAEIAYQSGGHGFDYLPLVEALPEDGRGEVLYALAARGKVEPEAALEFSQMALPNAKDELEKARYLRAAASACMVAGGRESQAAGYLEEALGILIDACGEDSELLPFYYIDLADVYRAIGEKDKAVGMAEKAVRLREAVYGKNNPETAKSYLCLAGAYKDVKRYYPALDYAETAQTIFDEYYPEIDLHRADALETEGCIHAAMEDYDSALDSLMKSYSIKAMIYKESDHPSLAELGRKIGLIHVLCASGYLEEAADAYESSLGESHPDTVSTFRTLDNLRRLISEDGGFDFKS